MNRKLRTILEKLGMTEFHNGRTGSGVLSTAVDEAEKAIRQAVGEEMLELIGEKESYKGLSAGQSQRARGRNSLRAELRQKIKEWQGGEDE